MSTTFELSVLVEIISVFVILRSRNSKDKLGLTSVHTHLFFILPLSLCPHQPPVLKEDMFNLPSNKNSGV